MTDEHPEVRVSAGGHKVAIRDGENKSHPWRIVGAGYYTEAQVAGWTRFMPVAELEKIVGERGALIYDEYAYEIAERAIDRLASRNYGKAEQ